MKFNTLIIILICICFLGLFLMTCMKLQQVVLPRLAHHNTFGELPVVEVMDDGDFYEEDGAEDLTSYNCNRIMSERCNKICKGKNASCSASCYLLNVKRCDMLHEKQLYADASSGNFTAQWLVYMNENCGNWACGGDAVKYEEVINQFKEKKNKEWGDKMIWLGNQGNFEKGYMGHQIP